MMKKRFCFSLLLLFAIAIGAMAQEVATVKDFIQTTDHISAGDRRNDFNGKPCALVKVQVVDEIERVEGNKIGDIVDKGVEKWVYMCKGSRNMRIHLKNHLPVRVMFQDYKIGGLESNRVYELVINTPNSGVSDNVKKQKFVLNYSPASATVMIDTRMFNGNGRIEVNLPIGEHKYLIAANNYYTVEGTVTLNENAPRVITEELTPDNTTALNDAQMNQQTTQPVAPQSSYQPRAEFNDEKKTYTVENITFTMIPVKGGSFVMGKPNPKAVRKVTVSDFYIGEMEVTEELWMAVMFYNPSSKVKPKNPVVNVSWSDCQVFINKLNQQTGAQFRLPTEAEWEFAARGGNMSQGFKFAGSNDFKDVCNYLKNVEVGKYRPNELGIYNMCGNAGEWCQDWSSELGYGLFNNPVGPDFGTSRVVRGVRDNNGKYEVWARFNLEPAKKKNTIGLRLAL